MLKIIELLNQKAVRITPMRQLLLKFFLQNNRTFGLKELEMTLPKSDRITIYRTLKTFEEKGILHSINNRTGEIKYALCYEQCSPLRHIDMHPHFHCEQCNQITCIASLIIQKVDLPYGFSKKETTLMIKGICPDC